MAFEKLDNTTFSEKVMLRRTGLQHLQRLGIWPVIMETHGGIGDIFAAIYNDVEDGVVFEKDPRKALILADQRPTWAVYEADCETALSMGAGDHLTVNLVDVDPYGQAWPTIRAFFASPRPFADVMVLAVNDGMRQLLRTHGGWQSRILAPVVERFGNDGMWENYLEISRFLLGALVEPAGYEAAFFDGYYTGEGQNLTHWLAVLERGSQ